MSLLLDSAQLSFLSRSVSWKQWVSSICVKYNSCIATYFVCFYKQVLILLMKTRLSSADLPACGGRGSDGDSGGAGHARTLPCCSPRSSTRGRCQSGVLFWVGRMVPPPVFPLPLPPLWLWVLLGLKCGDEQAEDSDELMTFRRGSRHVAQWTWNDPSSSI